VIVDTAVVVVIVDIQVTVVPVDTLVAVVMADIQVAVVPADAAVVVTPVIVVLLLPPVPAHIASHSIPPADLPVSAAAGVVVVLHFPQYCSMLFIYYFFTLSYFGFDACKKKVSAFVAVKHIIITVF
jgi:hypothetical protein